MPRSEEGTNEVHPSQAEKERQARQFNGPMRQKNVMDELQHSIMNWAELKGWNQGLDERSFGDWMTLLHSEISEAYEDHRMHRGLNEMYYEYYDDDQRLMTCNQEQMQGLIASGRRSFDNFKPCGIPIEMADLVIRVLHLAEFASFNLYNMIEVKMRYNHTRPHRHGGKRT